MVKNIDWTPELGAKALKLLRSGLTYRQAGQLIGVTKNSLLGYAARQGWRKEIAALNQRHRAAPPKDPLRSASVPPTRTKNRPATSTPKSPKRRAAATTPSPPEAKGGLRDRQNPFIHAPAKPSCCWPLWGAEPVAEKLFCAQPRAPGRPYCQEHVAQAYIPSPKRKEDFERLAGGNTARPTYEGD